MIEAILISWLALGMTTLLSLAWLYRKGPAEPQAVADNANLHGPAQPDNHRQ